MKKLDRSIDDKWLAGVCGGISSYTGIDANLIRLLVVIGTVMGAGTLIVAYIVAWVIVPQRTTTLWVKATDAPTTANGPARPSA